MEATTYNNGGTDAEQQRRSQDPPICDACGEPLQAYLIEEQAEPIYRCVKEKCGEGPGDVQANTD